MKHILLTGANGFLGSHLLEALLNESYRVTILKRSTSNTWRIDHLMGKVSAYDVDRVALDEAFIDKKVDVVIHTACTYGRDKETTSDILNTNLVFGVKLLEASIENSVGKFINTDTFFSGKFISNHLFDYSLSKRQFNEWLKNKSSIIKTINLRLQHVYGPKDNSGKFVPWLIDNIVRKDGNIQLTSGTQRRDFIYVTDAVNAYISAISYNLTGSSYLDIDVGTGEKTELRVFIETIYEEIQRRMPIKSRLGFGDIEKSNGEIEEIECDIEKLQRLGWVQRYTIVDGISEMLSKEGY